MNNERWTYTTTSDDSEEYSRSSSRERKSFRVLISLESSNCFETIPSFDVITLSISLYSSSLKKEPEVRYTVGHNDFFFCTQNFIENCNTNTSKRYSKSVVPFNSANGNSSRIASGKKIHRYCSTATKVHILKRCKNWNTSDRLNGITFQVISRDQISEHRSSKVFIVLIASQKYGCCRSLSLETITSLCLLPNLAFIIRSCKNCFFRNNRFEVLKFLAALLVWRSE